MPVRIRLSRVGKNNNPLFRVVVAEREKPRNGRFIEVLGNYDPKKREKKLTVNKERLQYWVSKGATLSAVVEQTFRKEKGDL